jgi:polysaccharide pyruvyl transferase WcaK-like protein
MSNIEIHGAGFQNKGAELMLRAAVHRLRDRLPGIEIAIDPSYGSFDQRAALGLRQMYPTRTHVGTRGFRKSLGSQKIFSRLAATRLLDGPVNSQLGRYGCVSLWQSQALVDIAGFAYSDEWGIRPTQDFSRLAAVYAERNKPVILMPQAFGPFDKMETKAAFRKIIDSASLIFARDRQSFEHVQSLVPGTEKVFLAPDITLFFPENDSVKKPGSDYVSIVPNIRMVDKNKRGWAEKYESYLILVIEEILRKGLRVKIIVHDISGQDIQLTESIAARVNSPKLSIFESDNPLVLKEEIGNSRLLVGSRYHSLVAAFSQSVPSIGLGWSHKYDMLFEDFDCKDLLISSDLPAETVIERVVHILEDDVNSHYRELISRRLGELRRQNEDMWNQVTQILRPCLNSSA